MKRTSLLLLLGVVIVVLGIAHLPTSIQAQDGGENINLGERKVGQINASNQQPTYSFTATANQQVSIDVTALTSQLALAFTVFNDSGALVVAVGNPTQANQISDTVTFPAAGVYTIQISNVSSVDGDFIISVLAPEPDVPATPLLAGQTQQNSLAQGAEVRYGITTNSETPLYLEVTIDNPTAGLDITLTDNNGEALAFVKNSLLGVRLLLPSGVADYNLSIANLHPAGLSIGFAVSLRTTPQNEQSGATPAPPPISTTPTATSDSNALPELPTSGPCKIATQGQIVNVREGPSTDYDIVATIGAYTIYDVLGRNEDGAWFQINAQPEIGWVARNVIRRGGNCDNTDLPLASYPPLLSTISGIVWHDLCVTPAGPPPPDPPTGCIADALDGLIGNGLFESGEPGISGVIVTLGLGACPTTALGSRTTNSAGQYFFEDLEAGTYCLSINALSPTNSAVLIPGLWTAPRTDTLASFTINLGAGDDRVINFGWDFQFAP